LRVRANVGANRCRTPAERAGARPNRLQQMLASISLSSVAVA